MPIKINLNAAAVKAIRDAADKGEPVTLTFDSGKIEEAAERLTDIFHKIGQTAEHIGNAAGNVSAATSSRELGRARRALASIGANAFAALLGVLGPVIGNRRHYD